jgi:hypothetical protein
VEQHSRSFTQNESSYPKTLGWNGKLLTNDLAYFRYGIKKSFMANATAFSFGRFYAFNSLNGGAPRHSA